MKNLEKKIMNRQDNEMPEAIEKWGWKFHHLGIPPSEGIRVAMIEHNGAPIELIEFEKNKNASA